MEKMLIKYSGQSNIQLISLSQKYNGCFVVWLLIVKHIGNHPLHKRLDQPTTDTILWHDIKSNVSSLVVKDIQCLLNMYWLHGPERF